MKHTTELEFTSHKGLTIPAPNIAQAPRPTFMARLKALLQPRFDPTRMTRTEQREAGLTDGQIDWYKAATGPLIK